MQPINHPHKMSRRAFAKLTALAVGAGDALLRSASGPGRALAAEPATVAVYALFPMEDGVLTRCSACLRHAEHERFATRDAAEANRAHPGCRCSLQVMQVPSREFARMFGGTGAVPDRTVFDLRQG